MTDTITISGKTYSVASNSMGVMLGLQDVYDNHIPAVFGLKEWIFTLCLSIYWGERAEGRESDLTVEKLCAMDLDELPIAEFVEIFKAQHKSDDSKKKMAGSL